MDTHIADMTGGSLTATSERRFLAAEETQRRIKLDESPFEKVMFDCKC
jgi:hypothetical protein